MMRVAVTGVPKIGKSTLCMKIVDALRNRGIPVGGMTSGEILERGTRVGFEIVDIESGRRGVLAHINQKQGPGVGKYRVNLDDLNRVGAQAIRDAVSPGAVLIVVDEIGPMELHSEKFVEAVETAITSEKEMLVSLHRSANHRLAGRIRKEFEVYELTVENRDKITDPILQRILGL